MSEVEQLWYTWSNRGLWGVPGEQLRAGSSGIQDRATGMAEAASIVCVHPGTTKSFGWLDVDGYRIVFSAVDAGLTREVEGRVGNFFVHALVADQAQIRLEQAAQLEHSPFWRVDDDDSMGLDLDMVEIDELTHPVETSLSHGQSVHFLGAVMQHAADHGFTRVEHSEDSVQLAALLDCLPPSVSARGFRTFANDRTSEGFQVIASDQHVRNSYLYSAQLEVADEYKLAADSLISWANDGGPASRVSKECRHLRDFAVKMKALKAVSLRKVTAKEAAHAVSAYDTDIGELVGEPFGLTAYTTALIAHDGRAIELLQRIGQVKDWRELAGPFSAALDETASGLAEALNVVVELSRVEPGAARDVLLRLFALRGDLVEGVSPSNAAEALVVLCGDPEGSPTPGKWPDVAYSLMDATAVKSTELVFGSSLRPTWRAEIAVRNHAFMPAIDIGRTLIADRDFRGRYLRNGDALSGRLRGPLEELEPTEAFQLLRLCRAHLNDQDVGVYLLDIVSRADPGQRWDLLMASGDIALEADSRQATAVLIQSWVDRHLHERSTTHSYPSHGELKKRLASLSGSTLESRLLWLHICKAFQEIARSKPAAISNVDLGQLPDSHFRAVVSESLRLCAAHESWNSLGFTIDALCVAAARRAGGRSMAFTFILEEAAQLGTSLERNLASSRAIIALLTDVRRGDVERRDEVLQQSLVTAVQAIDDGELERLHRSVQDLGKLASKWFDRAIRSAEGPSRAARARHWLRGTRTSPN